MIDAVIELTAFLAAPVATATPGPRQQATWRPAAITHPPS
jgi:hypothetical protein